MPEDDVKISIARSTKIQKAENNIRKWPISRSSKPHQPSAVMVERYGAAGRTTSWGLEAIQCNSIADRVDSTPDIVLFIPRCMSASIVHRISQCSLLHQPPLLAYICICKLLGNRLFLANQNYCGH